MKALCKISSAVGGGILLLVFIFMLLPGVTSLLQGDGFHFDPLIPLELWQLTLAGYVLVAVGRVFELVRRRLILTLLAVGAVLYAAAYLIMASGIFDADIFIAVVMILFILFDLVSAAVGALSLSVLLRER